MNRFPDAGHRKEIVYIGNVEGSGVPKLLLLFQWIIYEISF